MRLRRPRLRTALLVAGILLFAYALAGFYGLPRLVRRVAEDKLTVALRRKTSIGRVNLNPFTFTLTVRDLSIQEPHGQQMFFSFDELLVSVRPEYLVRRALVVRRLALKHPFLSVVRTGEHTYNFSDLLAPETSVAPAGKRPGFPRFSLANITVENGRIRFDDRPVKTAHTVSELSLGIPVISSLPAHQNIYVTPRFSAIVNDSPFTLNGRTKPFSESMETVFDVSLKEINLPHYLGYLPFEMKFRVPSGTMDTDLEIGWHQETGKGLVLGMSGTIEVKKLGITDRARQPVLAVPRLRVRIASFDIFGRNLRLSSVELAKPAVRIVRDPDGLNIKKILPPMPPSSAARGPDFLCRAETVVVTGCDIGFVDRAASAPFSTKITPVDLSLFSFSTARNEKTSFSLSARTEMKEEMRAGGTLTVHPFAADGTVELKKVPLATYAPYSRDVLLCQITGTLAAGANFSFRDGRMRLSEASATLSVLEAKKDGRTFFSAYETSLSGGSADLSTRTVTVTAFSTRRGSVAVNFDKHGTPDILPLVPARAEGVAQAKEEKPWTVLLRRAEMSDYSVSCEDRRFAEPVRFSAEKFQLVCQNISTEKNRLSPFSLSFLLNGRGTVSLQGEAGWNPPAGQVRFDFNGLPINPFQSYFTEFVRVTVTDGSLSAAGTVVLKTEHGALKSSYEGSASIDGFACVDRDRAEPCVSWRRFSCAGVKGTQNPTTLTVQSAELDGLQAHLIVRPDRTMNITDIVSFAGETAPAQKKEGSAVSIDAIVLKDGTVKLVDRNIQPSCTLSAEHIQASVTGISSLKEQPAVLSARAQINGASPVSITGGLRPVGGPFFLDVKADIRDVDLVPMEPYAERYVGYILHKGKLSVDASYRVDGRALKANNFFFVDQLTLGDRVESPDAIKAPVKFAVALLRDLDNRIRLDVPLSGTIDDPKFRIGPIIVKMIVNIIVKAVAAPFSLLGALFGGGGEELSFVEFEPGSSAITQATAGKLTVLEKAMLSRPALSLEIRPYCDGAKDAEALRQSAFRRRIAAQKIKRLTARGESVAVESAVVEPSEYEEYLFLAYKAEDIPKKRNLLGIVQKLPVPEMEQKILENITISDSDLRGLAAERARAVIAHLTGAGVPADRLFLIETNPLAPPPRSDALPSRVDFSLK